MKFNGIGGTTGCDSKQKFATKDLAERRMSRRRSKSVKPYHCAICGYWHNGGVELSRKLRLVRKTNMQSKLEKADAYDEHFENEEVDA